MRARLTLALLIALEAAGLALVVARVPAPAPVDWADPIGWLQRTDPETATLVIARLLAVVVGGWLLATTLVAVVARAALAAPALPRRCRTVAAGAARLAPGAVRHLVETAVAVGVVTSTLAPAAAVVAPLGPVRDGRAPVALAPVPASPPGPVPPPSAVPVRHRVAPGEHLWGIADAVVRAHGIDDPGAVDRYWRALCEANRGHIASGDPDLIRPGEELDLPPVA